MVTTEDLETIKKSLSLVTPGPWTSIVEGRDQTSGSSFIQTGDKDYDIDFIKLKEHDQDFIAMSRNMLPLLLEEINRLRKVLSENNISF